MLFRWRIAVGIVVIPLVALAIWSVNQRTSGEERGNASGVATYSAAHADRRVSRHERDDALARARIWAPPRVPVAAAYFGTDPSHPLELTCRFKVSELGGTTRKFDCQLENGETIRVKYGDGPELPAEAATTALLRALGFGADDVRLLERLRCYGCPDEPFLTMKAIELTGSASLYETTIDFDKHRDFAWVSIERKWPASAIESEDLEGWAFFELDNVDAAKGGAPRTHVDAMRLLAVFLAHWDNKAENQRLVCLSSAWIEGTPCPEPFLLLQDVGATFGPRKLGLESWKQVEIWKDRTSCTLSMSGLPHDGATFADVQITEEGRQFLGRLLSQLSERQLTDLFTTARFDQQPGLLEPASPVGDWIRAFEQKVSSITEGPVCPSVATDH
jgi:hypothetical protein